MKRMTDSGAAFLCRAILAQAANDYRMVLKHGDTSTVNRDELNKFFNGKLFHSMLGDSITPEQFKARVRARSIGFQINPYREENRW